MNIFISIIISLFLVQGIFAQEHPGRMRRNPPAGAPPFEMGPGMDNPPADNSPVENVEKKQETDNNMSIAPNLNILPGTVTVQPIDGQKVVESVQPFVFCDPDAYKEEKFGTYKNGKYIPAPADKFDFMMDKYLYEYNGDSVIYYPSHNFVMKFFEPKLMVYAKYRLIMEMILESQQSGSNVNFDTVNPSDSDVMAYAKENGIPIKKELVVVNSYGKNKMINRIKRSYIENVNSRFFSPLSGGLQGFLSLFDEGARAVDRMTFDRFKLRPRENPNQVLFDLTKILPEQDCIFNVIPVYKKPLLGQPDSSSHSILFAVQLNPNARDADGARFFRKGMSGSDVEKNLGECLLMPGRGLSSGYKTPASDVITFEYSKAISAMVYQPVPGPLDERTQNLNDPGTMDSVFRDIFKSSLRAQFQDMEYVTRIAGKNYKFKPFGKNRVGTPVDKLIDVCDSGKDPFSE